MVDWAMDIHSAKNRLGQEFIDAPPPPEIKKFLENLDIPVSKMGLELTELHSTRVVMNALRLGGRRISIVEEFVPPIYVVGYEFFNPPILLRETNEVDINLLIPRPLPTLVDSIIDMTTVTNTEKQTPTTPVGIDSSQVVSNLPVTSQTGQSDANEFPTAEPLLQGNSVHNHDQEEPPGTTFLQLPSLLPLSVESTSPTACNIELQPPSNPPAAPPIKPRRRRHKKKKKKKAGEGELGEPIDKVKKKKRKKKRRASGSGGERPSRPKPRRHTLAANTYSPGSFVENDPAKLPVEALPPQIPPLTTTSLRTVIPKKPPKTNSIIFPTGPPPKPPPKPAHLQ